MSANTMIDAFRALKERFGNERSPIAYVFATRMELAVRAQFHEIQESAPGLPALLLGPELYFDHRQEEECLVFYDRDVLRAYLNRVEDPKTWIECWLKLEREKARPD